MLKVLLAIDGSESSLHAVSHLVKRASAARDEYQIHLVNVQHPMHGDVGTFVDAAELKQYHHDEGMKVLTAASAQLDAAGLAYSHHLFVGEPAEVIARYAKEQACDEIIMGTRGLSGITSLLMGSVASKVVHLADMPVSLVK